MREPWYDATVALGSTLFRLLDLRLDVEGVERYATATEASGTFTVRIDDGSAPAIDPTTSRSSPPASGPAPERC